MNNARLALQTRLLAVVTASEVDWENSDYTVPALDVPYYKAYLLRGKNSNLAMDTMDGEGVGILQITLLYPVDKGTIPLETKAQAIIDHFVGQTLIETDTKVRILTQPDFIMLNPTNDRFIGAISIAYKTNKI